MKHVVWGGESYEIPEGFTQMASVVPQGGWEIEWKAVEPGDIIQTSEIPVILK